MSGCIHQQAGKGARDAVQASSALLAPLLPDLIVSFAQIVPPNGG